ncbi:ferritin-like domain-containing protein [Hymenobacter negativus]|uniref:PA2169 family four-helix-bundle protein n=1 Tax=Hymenobacter negativus TaxID=2795026 RepID=A0ABS3QMM1_9BACT|nr:PA2169 family four-helix-bundle protein [Hymenobacter negativus]MBO2012509.1 PA2169 family four-helix-bundle protein [Hymenobacter negativus]
MKQQTASTPGARTAETSHSNAANVLDKAQQWVKESNVGELLDQVPSSLKNVGTKGAKSFKKLSTTQKIVGGAALALGVGLLIRSSSKGSNKSDSQTATTVQELLHFVNDRIAGYERAVAESEDLDLRTYYQQLVSQSQQFAANLNTLLQREGGAPETGTTLKGKLYRTWMDTKAAVTGSDEKAILNSNVYGEEWAIKAYQDALRNHNLSSIIRQAIQHQYDTAQRTYKRLKQLEAQQ